MPRSWRSAARRIDKDASRPEGKRSATRGFFLLARCQPSSNAKRNRPKRGIVFLWNLDERTKQMDKNRIEGSLDKAKGSVKDAAGKVMGNDRLRAEGQADKIKGEVKEAAGKTADTVRHGLDKASDTISNASKH
jgi:uncharacterized protein YjbJ (UPF0337 family)